MRLTSEMLQRELEKNEKQQERLLSRLAVIESQPRDDFENGSIITFESRMFYDLAFKQFRRSSRRNYTYACLKAEGSWYATGKMENRLDWGDVMELVDGGDVWYVTALKELAE